MVPRSMFGVILEAWLILTSRCAFPVRHVNDIILVLYWIHGEWGCGNTQWFSTCLVIADLPWGQAAMIQPLLYTMKCVISIIDHLSEVYPISTMLIHCLDKGCICYHRCWISSLTFIRTTWLNSLHPLTSQLSQCGSPSSSFRLQKQLLILKQAVKGNLPSRSNCHEVLLQDFPCKLSSPCSQISAVFKCI